MGNAGYRIYTEIQRPDRAVIDLFKGLPTPNINDNMNRMFALRGLKPYNKTPLLGPAFTVRVAAGNNLLFNRAIDMAQPGDILVIDGGGFADRALCGEIMFTHAKKRGLGGFVVNGAIRDVEAAEKMDFPIYAVAECSNGPLKNGPGEINAPVVCGGLAIMPGDILVGDADGVVCVRPEDAKEVAEKAWKQNAAEKEILKMIEQQTWDRSGFPKKLADQGCEIIEGSFRR